MYGIGIASSKRTNRLSVVAYTKTGEWSVAAESRRYGWPLFFGLIRNIKEQDGAKRKKSEQDRSYSTHIPGDVFDIDQDQSIGRILGGVERL